MIARWSIRQQAPLVLSSSRNAAWSQPEVQELVHRYQLHQSRHRWCSFGVKLSAEAPASAACHKVMSSVPLADHPCKCARGVGHVFDLDMFKGEPGTAKVRADAERLVASHIIATLVGASSQDVQPEPSTTTDSIQSVSSSSLCTTSAQQQPSASCPQEVTSLAAIANAAPSVQPPRSREDEPASFPTEQKIQQRERAQARKAQGLAPHEARKRKKVVQQHFDDCGESLASLDMPKEYNVKTESFFVSDEETCSEEDTAACQIANAFAQWALPSTLAEGQPTLHQNSSIAVDIDEMFTILNEPARKAYGVEIVEICGGNALTSHLCVRRRLHSGHCFELITGTDLTQPSVQAKVLAYLDVARPLVIVMSPICTPFGPLGHRNYVLHHDAWSASFATAAPLAAFCGKLVLRQSKLRRFYLNEQPYPSAMYEIEPWPEVRSLPDCHRIVLHQCMLGLKVNGLLRKKPTEFTSNSTIILGQFAGLCCDRSLTMPICWVAMLRLLACGLICYVPD